MSILWRLATAWWSGVPRAKREAMQHVQSGRYAEAARGCHKLLLEAPHDPEVPRILARIMGATVGAVEPFQRSGDADSIRALRHSRRELVSLLHSLPPEILESWWKAHLGPACTAVGDSGLRNLPRDDEDERALAALCPVLARGHGDDRYPWMLLAGTLLGQNFELPLADDLARLPDWLRERYCTFLLEMPAVFNRVGEAAAYADYLARAVALFHRTGINERGIDDRAVARELTGLFAARASFLQAYFSTRNLRCAYAQRGDLVAAAQMASGATTLAALQPRTTDHGKIRLGIFAHHLSPQTETYFTLAHYDHIDRSRFDITLYAMMATGHALERHCIECADRFKVLPPDDLPASVQQVRADDLDILLIGTNMSALTNSAALLGAYRLARVQIASVSSPTTTGMRHTDMVLSAQWNEPAADAAEHYTEDLRLMPGSINYYAFEYDTDPATMNFSRAGLGVADGAILFFSGANYFKIIPELSRTWVRILAAVPNSALLLMPFNVNWSPHYQTLPFMARLKGQMEELGVAADRLKVLTPVPTRADVQRVLAAADVYLDAYPFAGACSMLDPVIAGVPPIVRSGPVGRSNFGASMMRMLGLEELICASEEQYVAAAVAMATDSARRDRIRAALQALNARVPPPYFDIAGFSRKVGDTLAAIHGEYVGRYRALEAAGGAALREDLQRLADSVVGRNFELNSLTDIGLVRVLIEPFFRAHPGGRARHMIDVGACYGEMARPFLAAGWTADLFEPDPAARRVLEREVASFGSRARVVAAAVSNGPDRHVAFHKARTNGLSGLSGSPFGPTEAILEVPCVRLADFCSEHGVALVDFLKIDAEGHDFDVLESHDFAARPPRIVMVEYGTHFPRQSLDTVNRGIARMATAGYGSVSFAYDDDGNFSRGSWNYRLTQIFVDRPLPEPGRPAFGNILFYRADDTEFLLALHALLDTCRPRSSACTQAPP